MTIHIEKNQVDSNGLILLHYIAPNGSTIAAITIFSGDGGTACDLHRALDGIPGTVSDSGGPVRQARHLWLDCGRRRPKNIWSVFAG